MAQPKGDEIRARLIARIDQAAVGDRIPPERQLCAEYGVARETMRRVIEELADDGLLERRAGVGTFVARPKITQQFWAQSFTEDMAARGRIASSKVLASRVHPAGASLGARLTISPGDDVLSLERLRLADGQPMALEYVSIPLALIPGLDAAELDETSLYRLLADRYGIRIFSGSQTIEATVTEEHESRALDVPLLSPALLVKRVTWTESGRRIEAVRTVYRGDRYRFEVELSRSPVHESRYATGHSDHHEGALR